MKKSTSLNCETSRRGLLARSLELTGVLAAARSLLVHPTFGADEASPVRLGLIGCGGIMTTHVKGLVGRREKVEISWLCDVDPRQTDEMSKLVSGDFQSFVPRQTSRFEDVLNDSNVDACIIATPHHWHAPIALRAMQSGKDVYIEKPISHVYNEGPLIAAAAEKYGRIVQQGSQMRSSPVTRKAEQLLKDGVIGEVKVARAWTAELRTAVPAVPDEPVPMGVDYDRWLGPASSRPFNPHRFHKTWRMFRDYGNGEIGDDGIHDLDMAAWGLGVETLPSQITARGSRKMLGDQVSEYPDNMTVTYEYSDGRLLIYENYPFTAYGLHGFDNGNVFYGTAGYMVFSRRGAFSVFQGPKSVPGPTEGKELRGRTGYPEHMADFLTAVRSRSQTRATPAIAHRSCALVHLGEIAFQTTGRLDFDPVKEIFPGSEEANQRLSKVYREPFGLP